MGTGEIPILEDGYIFIIFPSVYYHWILRLQTLGVTSTGIEIIDYRQPAAKVSQGELAAVRTHRLEDEFELCDFS